MTPHQKDIAISSAMILTALYVAAPVAAGYFDHGDVGGPGIYPELMHSVLFQLGFSLGGHPGSPVGHVPERPWFY